MLNVTEQVSLLSLFLLYNESMKSRMKTNISQFSYFYQIFHILIIELNTLFSRETITKQEKINYDKVHKVNISFILIKCII